MSSSGRPARRSRLRLLPLKWFVFPSSISHHPSHILHLPSPYCVFENLLEFSNTERGISGGCVREPGPIWPGSRTFYPCSRGFWIWDCGLKKGGGVWSNFRPNPLSIRLDTQAENLDLTPLVSWPPTSLYTLLGGPISSRDQLWGKVYRRAIPRGDRPAYRRSRLRFGL